MTYSIILIKITGVVLLAGTIRSIFKHFAASRAKAVHTSKNSQGDQKQSLSEQLLNNLLLYLWLAFMLIFSTGMIVNN